MNIRKSAALWGLCVIGLGACVPPVAVDTDLSACPFTGLASVAFFSGPPAEGRVIAPVPTAAGGLDWVLRGKGIGDVHVSCRYDSGLVRVQKLPPQVTSCAQADAALPETLRCRARF